MLLICEKLYIWNRIKYYIRVYGNLLYNKGDILNYWGK